MARSAIISGGSIGGLFAACALQKAGWDVSVYERSAAPLSGRGAGIVTHPELIAALGAVGADTSALGVTVDERAAYDITGARVAAFDFHQIVTSWDRMFQVLRQLIPDHRYHMGATVTGYREAADNVETVFDDGTTQIADILIGADGFRSAVRAQFAPDITPEYSGYVVWRTLAAEADLPQSVRGDIFKTFGYFIPNGTQIIGYPIAGPDNDLRPGHLRYNFVWYATVDTKALDDMRTDATGRHHSVSIPPPLIRDEIIQAMYADARARLPQPFNDILAESDRPFFTPIYDHWSPMMGRGRVALSGDAACVARPHVGMGVTKAAADALTLAQHLADANSIQDATHSYSNARAPACQIARDTARWLGSLIFDGDPAQNTDGRTHPQMDAVMRETAVVPAALRDPT